MSKNNEIPYVKMVHFDRFGCRATQGVLRGARTVKTSGFLKGGRQRGAVDDRAADAQGEGLVVPGTRAEVGRGHASAQLRVPLPNHR